MRLGKCDGHEGSINVKRQCERCLRSMLTSHPLLFPVDHTMQVAAMKIAVRPGYKTSMPKSCVSSLAEIPPFSLPADASQKMPRLATISTTRSRELSHVGVVNVMPQSTEA